MFNLLLDENLFSEVWINVIAGIISSALLAILPFVIGLVKTKSKNKFYKALFNVTSPSETEKIYIKHYVKHAFEKVYPCPILGEEKNVNYKSLVKEIKSEKLKTTIILGSSGIGKSTLMCKLAYLFRSKPNENDGKRQSAINYGILFYKLGRGSSIGAVLADIGRKLSSDRTYILFLDGLDEVPDLQNESGEAVLNKLLIKLFSSEYSSGLNKIFISLRPEILSKGYSYAFNIQPQDISDSTAIYKICNFNEKQILTMYRRERYSYKNGVRMKADLFIRRQNYKKLRQVVKENPQSIFTYPLILTWANEILCDYNIEKLKYISWYDALGKVIEKESDREYDIELSKKGKIIGVSADERDKYKEDFKKFLLNIALRMAQTNSQRVAQSVVSEVASQLNLNGEPTVFLARRLLRYIERSETENGEKSEPYYEFIHNTVYWRALAEAMLNPHIPQTVRAAIITGFNKDTPVLQYCRQGLYSVYGEKIFPYWNEDKYFAAVENKVIECNVLQNVLPCEIVLSCFYGIDQVVFNISSDSAVKFGFAQIKEFVENRKVDFSNSPISDLTILQSFSDSSFNALYCSNSDVVTVKIPDYVTGIKFLKCTSLKNVEIGNGVQSLGEYVFDGCTSLESITIPSNVKDIGKGAFLQCTSLKNVEIGSGVQSLGEQAFGGCTSLESITIPDRVKDIGEGAFLQCTSLNSVNIDNGVELIGEHIFDGCTSLESITIPNNVKVIGGRAFIGCTSLKNVEIGSGVQSLGEHVFDSCTSLESITIPDNVKVIDESAFIQCTSLKNVKIGSGVQSIAKKVFDSCTSLENITIPDSVKEIGECAFIKCTSLKSVKIGSGLQSLGEHIFDQCVSLENITIPDSVKEIGKSAFIKCTSLKNVKIGSGLQSLGEQAFGGCTSLEGITIPDNVKVIGRSAFLQCTSLKSVKIGSGLQSLGEHIFDQCVSLENITIPNNVKVIGERAFVGCTSLEGITIPDNVKELGEGAFIFCTSLKNVGIGNGVQSLGEQAFGDCTSLESITIPDSVKEIGKSAFIKCTSLKNVKIGSGLQSLGEHVFDQCVSLEGITIPDNVKELGKGAFAGCTSLENITIPDNVKVIDESAFIQCTSLKNVKIGSGVQSLGEHVFDSCTSLESVTIPDNVKEIGEGAFIGCTSLKNVVIGNGVQSLGEQAFAGCTSLESITIPESVKKIGKGAFANSGIAAITFGGTVSDWEKVEKAETFYLSEVKEVVCKDGSVEVK